MNSTFQALTFDLDGVLVEEGGYPGGLQVKTWQSSLHTG